MRETANKYENVVIGKDVTIGRNVTFGSNVTLGNSIILGDNVTIGNNVTIGSQAVIAAETQVGHNAVIYDRTKIGSHSIIQDGVVIGKQPARAKASILPESAKQPPAFIGEGVTVGTSAIIYANAEIANEVFVADLATIRERVTVGEGTIIGRGVAVENDCKVGKRCKLETNCYISAYSELGDYVFIAPNVVTTNDNYMARGEERFGKFKGVTIKDGGRVGANSTILPGRVIYEDGAVGAGSIVTKDVLKEVLVVGSPAKKLREVPKEQLLINQK